MDFRHLARNRKSIRAFLDKDIPEAELMEIAEAANLAPSAGNLQAYHFYLVTSRKKKEELAEAALGQSFIAEAPAVFVFFAEPKVSAPKYGKRGEKLYALLDAAIAAAYAQLAAEEMGYGTVWVGAFGSEKVGKVCGNDGIPVCILPVGMPAEKPSKPDRKNRLKAKL
jgi:nitroreductase